METGPRHEPPNPPPPSQGPSPLFRRVDQIALLGILLVCFALIGLFVIQLGIIKQGAVDFDQRPQRDAQLSVDVNVAPWSDFASLPGIGEHLGREIVRYRQANGEFQSIAELQNVPGIGETRLRRIAKYLSVTHAVSK